MKLLRILGLVAVALSLTLLPACRRGSGKPKVAFVTNNPEEFWTICEAGTRKAEKEFDVEVVFRRPQDGTAASQKRIIQDLLTQRVKAISISVEDPENQTGFLDEVAGKTILLTVDNDAPDSKRRCYLGTNNLEAGRAAGELVKEVMPGGGKIAIFVGNLNAINARERRQGVLDALEGLKKSTRLRDSRDGTSYGKYHLIGTYTDGGDSKVAKDKARDVLTKYRGEKNLCLIGLWAYNPPAILGAVEAARRTGEVKIVGFDEMEKTLDGIKDGVIHGTIVQDPFQFGYQSVKMMAELVRDPDARVPADGIHYIPHRVLRQDNVEEFHENLKKLMGK